MIGTTSLLPLCNPDKRSFLVRGFPVLKELQIFVHSSSPFPMSTAVRCWTRRCDIGACCPMQPKTFPVASRSENAHDSPRPYFLPLSRGAHWWASWLWECFYGCTDTRTKIRIHTDTPLHTYWHARKRRHVRAHWQTQKKAHWNAHIQWHTYTHSRSLRYSYPGTHTDTTRTQPHQLRLRRTRKSYGLRMPGSFPKLSSLTYHMPCSVYCGH